MIEPSENSDYLEQFVELDSSQCLAIGSRASIVTIQKKLHGVLPLMVTDVDAIWSLVDGVGRDLSSFLQAIGQDLDLQENVLFQL